jgi:hypothetical protein
MKALMVGLFLLGLLALLYNQKLAASGLVQENAPQVVLKTSALKVLDVVRNPVGSQLAVKNVSTKNINGYSVAIDEGRNTITVDMTVGEQVIGPGSEFKIFVSREVKKQYVIRHVMFDDGTSDGDPAAIAEQRDRREGARELLMRIAPLLRSGIAVNLEKLKSEIEAVPTETDIGRSVYVVLGMRNAKEDVLTDLNKIREGDVHAGVARISENYNRRVLRLTRTAMP